MSLLSGLTTDTSIADEKDSVGGGYAPLDSGLYNATISLAYVSKASSGALGLNLVLTTDAGKDIRQTLWMTSGTAKGCKNYYEDKNGDKQYLPGFLHANALTLLTLGKEIGQLDTEKKVINLYSAEAKAEVPTLVDMLTDLLGQEILVGVIKQVVDKNIANPGFNPALPEHKVTNPKYIPSGETREENEIDKFFRASDRKTTAEIRAQAPEAVFADTWVKKWDGQVKDKATKTAGTAGAPSTAAATGGTAKPTTSLFG